MHFSVYRVAIRVVLCAASIAVVINAAPRACAQSDAGAILSKYETALETLRHVEYNAHVATYEKQGNESEKQRQDMRYAWRCKGGLAKVSMEGKIWDLRSDDRKVLERKSVVLLDPRGDRTNVAWGPGGAISILMDRKPSEAQRRQVFGVAPFTLMHGYLSLSGVPYLPDVLRQSRLTARTESLDQRHLVLLEGTGRSGQIKLWCDPATGFWPRKLEWRLGATDVLQDSNDDKAQEKTLARLGVETIMVSVDGWDYARVSDQWVPTRFTEQQTYTLPDKPATVRRSVCTVSDTSIAPGHLNDPAAFELGSEIPNGSRVTVSNERQIEYIWRDGSVVKKIDADPGALEGHSVSRTEAPKSFITLWVIAAILAVVIAFLVVWRRSIART